jgi:glycerophosphoryl diester phosphodiesterase
MIPLPNAFRTTPMAHRGLHTPENGVIENSLSAVRAAIGKGYGVELDLQLSADGEAMVFHDDDLDRLTSQKGAVHRFASSVLQTFPLKGGHDTPLPLSTILSEIRGRIPILLELKDQGDRDTGMLEQAVAAALGKYIGPVAVMSFNPRMVARLAEMAPEVPRGLTTGTFNDEGMTPEVRDHLRAITDFDAVGASFISHEAADLDSPRVAEIKAAGHPILTWTIRSPQAEAVARKVADNITFEGYLPSFP